MKLTGVAGSFIGPPLAKRNDVEHTMEQLMRPSSIGVRLSVGLTRRVASSVKEQIKESKWFVPVVFALLTQVAQTIQGRTPVSTVLFPIFLVSFVYLVVKYVVVAIRPERLSASLDALSAWLRDPNQFTEEFAKTNGASDNLIVGKTIEVYPHPHLSTRAEPSRLGWAPEQVELIDRRITFDSSETMQMVESPYTLSPNEENWPKFMLTDISNPLADDTKNLKLSFCRTDYVTFKSARRVVEEGQDSEQSGRARQLRARLGNPFPHRNLVPHSVGLQYLVQFRGGHVLLLKRRSRGLDHQAGKWSISGEEQLQVPDFRPPSNATAIFRRAFCEEVACFTDNDPSTMEQRWATVRELVGAMRLWSIFYEEYCANHQMFGYMEVVRTPDEFVAWYTRHRDLLQGLKDKGEGRHFVASVEELDELLLGGQCRVRGLFDGAATTLRSDELHATSRYRLLRFLRAIYGDIPAHWRSLVRESSIRVA
jgi:hypothetical protein